MEQEIMNKLNHISDLQSVMLGAIVFITILVARIRWKQMD